MFEDVTFGVTLNDGVSGPAKKAVDALRAVENSASKAQSALGGKFANSWEKIGYASARAASKQQKGFADSWNKIGAAAQKAHDRAAVAAERSAKRQEVAQVRAMERAKKAHERLLEKQKEHSLFAGMKEGLGFTHLASAAFVGSLGAEALIEGVKKAVEIFTDGIKDAFKASAKSEKLDLNFELSLGKHGGKESREDIERFAKKTKFDDDEIAPMLLGLRRAGMGQEGARSAFAVATDVEAAGGMKTADMVGMFEHLFYKGGITSKQVTGMQINTPEFYKRLGKKLQVSAATAEKMASEGGKIDPQTIINLIQKGIEEKQGGMAGTGGEREAGLMESKVRKIGLLPDEYFKKMHKTEGWDALSKRLDGVLEALNPDSEKGQKIMATLMKTFDKIAGAMETLLNPENIERFVAGMTKLVELAGKFTEAMLPAVEALTGNSSSGAKRESNKTKKLVTDNIQGAGALIDQGDAWDKVREAYDVGFFDDLAISPEDKKSMAAKAYSEHKINKKEAQALGVQIGSQNISVTVNVPAGEDPVKTGHGIAQGISDHNTKQFERARDEAGAP